MLAFPIPVQDPCSAGRCTGTESASARSLAVAYSTLSKVLSALRNTSASSGALGQQAAATAASSAAAQQQQPQQQLLQHVPWRDSPLTRWLQEQLHAANAILVLGTISFEIEVRRTPPVLIMRVQQLFLPYIWCWKLTLLHCESAQPTYRVQYLSAQLFCCATGQLLPLRSGQR